MQKGRSHILQVYNKAKMRFDLCDVNMAKIAGYLKFSISMGGILPFPIAHAIVHQSEKHTFLNITFMYEHNFTMKKLQIIQYR